MQSSIVLFLHAVLCCSPVQCRPPLFCYFIQSSIDLLFRSIVLFSQAIICFFASIFVATGISSHRKGRVICIPDAMQRLAKYKPVRSRIRPVGIQYAYFYLGEAKLYYRVIPRKGQPRTPPPKKLFVAMYITLTRKP